MKKGIAVAAMMLGMVVLGTGVFANDANTPRVDRRETRQQNRIQQGTESGQLTTKESMHLQKQQDRINTMEAKAKADGVVTRKERARITHAQNKANRNIYRKKHNARTQ